MSRSKSRHEDLDASGTSLIPVDYESVFCSECGASYIVAPDPSQSILICPTCGPSLPIESDDHQLATVGRRRRRLLPRISFAWLQFATICLTFAGFLALVLAYLDSGAYVKTDHSESKQQPAMAKADTDDAGSDQVDANKLPGNDPSSTTSADATNTAPSEASADVRVAALPNEQPNVLELVETSAQEYTPAPADFVRPIEDGVGISEVLKNINQLFGQELRLQCRVTDVVNDAEGRVPDHFEINGQTILVEAGQEDRYRRLEVTDVTGKSFPGVYLQSDGPLQQEFSWMLPGDWVVLVATPGWRRDRFANRHIWGLVVTDIVPAQPTLLTPEATSRSVDARRSLPPGPVAQGQ